MYNGAICFAERNFRLTVKLVQSPQINETSVVANNRPDARFIRAIVSDHFT